MELHWMIAKTLKDLPREGLFLLSFDRKHIHLARYNEEIKEFQYWTGFSEDTINVLHESQLSLDDINDACFMPLPELPRKKEKNHYLNYE